VVHSYPSPSIITVSLNLNPEVCIQSSIEFPFSSVDLHPSCPDIYDDPPDPAEARLILFVIPP